MPRSSTPQVVASKLTVVPTDHTRGAFPHQQQPQPSQSHASFRVHRVSVSVLVACLVLLKCLVVPVHAATSTPRCPFCVHGVLSTAGSCKCACAGLALGPACSYTASDNASLVVYLNATADRFNAAALLRAVATACAVDASRIIYGYAVSTARFNATTVTLSVPGFAAGRLFVSVEVQDAWVAALGVVGVYPVIPLHVSTAPLGVFDLVLYADDRGVVVVTLAGIGWIAGCLLLAVAIVGVERRWLWNAEANFTAVEEEGPTAEVRRRRSLLYKRSNTPATPTTVVDIE